MESNIRGVPPSGAHMGRSDSTVSGIRAPITVDDSDFECSGSSYYSGSELEGFESGEDVPEKDRVIEEGEGIVEETDIVKELAILDGAVVDLKGEVVEGSSRSAREFVQESGNVGGIDVFRPLARYPSGKIDKGAGNIGDSDDSGSLLSDSSDDEIFGEVKYGASLGGARPVVAVVNEDVSEAEFTPVTLSRVLSARELSMPVAKISGDSDDDSSRSEILDDEVFSGFARVPSIEVLHRVNSAPKVRMLEGDEWDENESEDENYVEMELVGDLLESGMDLGPLDVKEPLVVEDPLPEECRTDYSKETMAGSLVMNEYNPTSELRNNGDLIYVHDDIKEVYVVEDRKECVELVDFREPADFAESILLPKISCVASDEEAEVSELGASLDGADCKSSTTVLEDICIFNQDSERGRVESMKQEIEHTVESFSSMVDHEVCSAHQYVDINEIPAALTCALATDQSVSEGSKLEQETAEGTVTSELLPGEVEKSCFDSDNKVVIAEIDVIQDSTTHTGGILLDHLQEIDGEGVEEFHDEVDVDGEINNRRRITDPVALAALCKNVRSAASDDDDDDDIKSVSLDGTENSSQGRNLDDLGIFDPARAGIAATTHGVNPSVTNGEFRETLSEREKEDIKKLQKIRVRYLRLLDRLGRPHEDSVASEVLHQLTLTARTGTGSSNSLAFHLDSIKNAAMELKAQTKDNLDFPLTVLIIGKTGVGKSATVNSIFGEGTAVVDAFEPATTRVKEITRSINGVRLKIFDTPGLRSSSVDQSINRKILSSIKKVMRKSSPDVTLYVDRLDTQRGDLNDLPLLRLVTSCLGSSIWRKCIVAFTHGSAEPPDDPSGYPLSYEAFVAQQFLVIQQLISHSAGESVVVNSDLIRPVCVVENHPLAEKSRCGETFLYNGERWRSQLLLLCCSMKILSEVFELQMHSPPLSYYLSSFLNSNVHPELSNDQSGYLVGSDVEVFHSSDSNQEEDAGKQSIEEARRFRSLSRSEVVEQETESPESVVVPLPDMTLPPSFDGDNPSLIYHVREHISRLRRRPVLISQWDHNRNYDGLSTEDKIDLANRIPAMILLQLNKDKQEFNIELHSSVSAKHGDKGSTVAGLDILPVEEKLAYTLKGEIKIKKFRKHRTAAAASITFVGENMVSGLIFEDCTIRERIALVGNAGIIQSQGDASYGVSLDLCRRDKDVRGHPVNKDETSFGMSVMKCRGELIYGCNLHSGISINRSSKLDITGALNNRLMGRISIKTTSSDQLQIAALALVPIATAVMKKFFGQSIED